MSPSNWKVSICFVKVASTSAEVLESKAQPSMAKELDLLGKGSELHDSLLVIDFDLRH